MEAAESPTFQHIISQCCNCEDLTELLLIHLAPAWRENKNFFCSYFEDKHIIGKCWDLDLDRYVKIKN